MAKRNSTRKNVIKYFLFTIIVLLVTVSLLSLFVFKYANFASNNVVLGANTTNTNSAAFTHTLTCGQCFNSTKSMVIVLQKLGVNSKEWGAKCMPLESLNGSSYVAYIACPVVSPMPKSHISPLPARGNALHQVTSNRK
jgi:hypothetical protein